MSAARGKGRAGGAMEEMRAVCASFQRGMKVAEGELGSFGSGHLASASRQPLRSVHSFLCCVDAAWNERWFELLRALG